MATIEEKVRQIEDSAVRDLAQVDVDDVYEQMDYLLRERPTPLQLYDRWEAQNWKVADLDFSEDAEHWQILKDQMPEAVEEFLRTFTAFFIGEQAVTDTLAPLIIAAPDEPNRIFLSTQIVDEARHTVFFARFFEDVLGVSGGLSAALSTLRPGTVEGFKKIFDDQLVEAMDRCRLNPQDLTGWVRGIAIYHLVIEGMLALTGQKYLLRIFRDLSLMPGFRAGFTAVTRDESRHVNWGVGAIRQKITEHPKLHDEVADAVFWILEPAVKTIEPADRPYADGAHPNDFPPQLRINPREVYSFSLTSLTKRLRSAGLSTQVCEEVERRGTGYYEAQISFFEDKFGMEHGSRYYDRGEVILN
jgi:ribonucleoside-diphosphate reductase beta chain